MRVMTLKQYFDRHGISQRAFAHTIGTTPVAVSRYVSGLRLPRPEIINRIAKATGGLVTAADWYAPVEERHTA
jgi:transcriptional regulator with XRE-family HTH domain